jgi:probable rRNA maturation factor
VAIYFTYEVKNIRLRNKAKYRVWLSEIARREKKLIGEIKFIFVNKEKIIEINRNFLDHNYYTDIITFDNSFLNTISGDIYISISSVKENSKVYSLGIFEKELNRVIVHGLLHLLGYMDKTEEEIRIMREKEDYYLTDFN